MVHSFEQIGDLQRDAVEGRARQVAGRRAAGDADDGLG
mgnify:FL=1